MLSIICKFSIKIWARRSPRPFMTAAAETSASIIGWTRIRLSDPATENRSISGPPNGGAPPMGRPPRCSGQPGSRVGVVRASGQQRRAAGEPAIRSPNNSIWAMPAGMAWPAYLKVHGSPATRCRTCMAAAAAPAGCAADIKITQPWGPRYDTVSCQRRCWELKHRIGWLLWGRRKPRKWRER